MSDKHKYVILFEDGREIVTPPAEELKIEPQESEGRLRKGRLALFDGQSATIFLDVDRVLAIYPVANPDDPLPRSVALQRGVSDREAEWTFHSETRWREQEYRRKEKRAAQGTELDAEITAALVRFGQMNDSQLMQPYPILRSFERRGRVPTEVAEFVASLEAVRERMNFMAEDGLVRLRSGGWYGATEKGTELAALGLPHVLKDATPSLVQHRRTMIDLCQSIMASALEEARWVTERELLDGAVRARLEAEVGRRLPAGRPSPAPRAWPSTPQGVLTLQETGAAWAVELELTRVSDAKLAHYEVVLGGLARDPALDHAYLVFREEEALERVAEVARHYRKDGFFVLRKYRIDDPLGFREREG